MKIFNTFFINVNEKIIFYLKDFNCVMVILFQSFIFEVPIILNIMLKFIDFLIDDFNIGNDL